MPQLSIAKKYQIPLSPEQLFAAWISPEMTVAPVAAIESDPRVGGHYRLIVMSPEGRSVMNGEFLEFERPTRLLYSWEWDQNGERTEITVDFVANDGGTEILLTHRGFEAEASRAMHDTGWDAYIAGLVEKLGV